MELYNPNKRFNFNPLKYEEQLSTFGKKVLNELVKKWNRDKILRDRTLRYRNAPSPTIQNTKRKVITFNPESPLRRSSPPMHDPNYFAYSLQTPVPIINNNLQLNGPPNVPSSNELVQTFDFPHNYDKFITKDLLNTVNDKYSTNNSVSCDNNTNGDENEPIVDWDNMFDTELFSNFDLNTKNSNNENNLTNNADVVESSLLNDPREINFKIPSIPPHTKEKQKTKRKTQAKITDTVPKKVKNVISGNKNTLRKQKYTTTIKNWLEDIDTSNPVEKESISTYKEFQDNNSKFTTVIEKHKPSAVKKVVQAQLANKDGIMKYSKPKNSIKAININNPGDLVGTDASNNDPKETDGSNQNNFRKKKDKMEKAAIPKTITDSLDKTSSNSEKVKEKKSKPKFIAPIKSQIPIKDITFEVINLGDTDKSIELLNNVKDEQIIVVLIYSNGFSQLNKHHTEDSCEPEGLLINVEEMYYYFKGQNDSYNEILKEVLEKNIIVCFNGKHILMYLKSQYDVDTHNSNIIDIQIGCSILQPDSTTETYSDMQKTLSYTPQYTIATECHLQKTAWYMTTLRECYTKLVAQLQEDDLWRVFVHIEMKLLPIIAG